jgi:ABC-type Fe3+/spermidine/putrescine transport system ATPase subunit
MSRTLECRDIRKRYGTLPYSLGRAERGIDLSVGSGELFAIIGPSGCGKSTLLRIIGGFVGPTSGRVAIGGRDVTALPPHARPTNTVFQNYALFPHLTIGRNVSFGLEMEKVPGGERRARVAAALELVGLTGFADRHVGELSGGQLQRAALARALVKRPAVLLLDEPLGALDLKLRRQMQDEIVQLKIALGMTIVHVTHDQEEACAMADRIAVLNAGVVLQVASPMELYRAPVTTFVADFIHAGTIIRGCVAAEERAMRLDRPGLSLAGDGQPVTPPGPIAALLPRHGALIRRAAAGEEAGVNSVRATLSRLAFVGTDFVAQLRLPDGFVITLQLPLDVVAASALDVGVEVIASWRPEQIRFIEDDMPTAGRRAAAA